VASDNPDEWLTVKGNHWWQGNNNVMVDCTFTARKTSDTTYDVELTYQTVDGSDDYRGYKKTLTVRKDGDNVLVKDIKDETKFKIKAQIIHLDDHTWVMKMDEGMTNSSIR
jgi:hypothetical protein